jgi:hypothetical protein
MTAGMPSVKGACTVHRMLFTQARRIVTEVDALLGFVEALQYLACCKILYTSMHWIIINPLVPR